MRFEQSTDYVNIDNRGRVLFPWLGQKQDEAHNVSGNRAK